MVDKARKRHLFSNVDDYEDRLTISFHSVGDDDDDDYANDDE